MTASEEVSSAWAEALFASALQRWERPTPDQVRAAVAAALQRHGELGCAARVAQEFGEHPNEAVARMSWVLAEVEAAFAPASAARER